MELSIRKVGEIMAVEVKGSPAELVEAVKLLGLKPPQLSKDWFGELKAEQKKAPRKPSRGTRKKGAVGSENDLRILNRKPSASEVTDEPRREA